jgi:hypothetical protein
MTLDRTLLFLIEVLLFQPGNMVKIAMGMIAGVPTSRQLAKRGRLKMNGVVSSKLGPIKERMVGTNPRRTVAEAILAFTCSSRFERRQVMTRAQVV